jgi:hypothetical protein
LHRLAAAVLAMLVFASAAVAGTDPRREQERLNSADTALAKRTALQVADLGTGWKRERATAGDDTAMPCGLDFSAFTITGKAESRFTDRAGASLMSRVEVYETRAQALGDYRVGTQPSIVGCLRRELERALKEDSTPGLTMTLRSARTIAFPRVGDRSAAYRFVLDARGPGGRIAVYNDVVVFQRGRTIVALMATSAGKPLAGRPVLARRIAARMR